MSRNSYRYVNTVRLMGEIVQTRAVDYGIYLHVQLNDPLSDHRVPCPMTLIVLLPLSYIPRGFPSERDYIGKTILLEGQLTMRFGTLMVTVTATPTMFNKEKASSPVNRLFLRGKITKIANVRGGVRLTIYLQDPLRDDDERLCSMIVTVFLPSEYIPQGFSKECDYIGKSIFLEGQLTTYLGVRMVVVSSMPKIAKLLRISPCERKRIRGKKNS